PKKGLKDEYHSGKEMCMERPRIVRIVLIVLTTTLFASLLRAVPPATAPILGEDSARSFALLVGVSKYETLPAKRHLKGPFNDVDLMRALLREKFGFSDANMVTLREGDNPATLPTRANIMKQLEALASRTQRGDRV